MDGASTSGATTQAARLFVTNIPKHLTREEAIAFLSGICSDMVSTSVLRGAGSHGHKGCGYLCFGSHVAAVKAARALTDAPVSWPSTEGEPVMVRLADDEGSSATHMESLEGRPLPPPLCLRHPFACCAFVSSSFNINELSESVELLSPAVVVGGAPQMLAQAPSRVVCFPSSSARDETVQHLPNFLARCGPPSLAELLIKPTVPLTSPSTGSANGRKRPRAPVETSPPHWQPLNPAEALLELRELFEGRGRVAVKDSHGNVAILRLPTYVESLE